MFPMKKAVDQEEIGEQIYFFRSHKEDEKRCLVFAHGAQFYGDGEFWFEGKISFVQRTHGKVLLTNPVQILSGVQEHFMEHFPGPGWIRNYSLGKAVGSHWKGDTLDYVGVRRTMDNQLRGNWTPHVVVIRYRVFKDHMIKLQDTLKAIQGHEPSANHFYIGACREDFTGNKKLSDKKRKAF